jgi:hypothetical protein
MTTPADPGSTHRSTDEIEADIGRSREELAETVDELTRRLDVPARVEQGVRERRDRAARALRERPVVPALAALGVLAVGVVLAIRQHRKG